MASQTLFLTLLIYKKGRGEKGLWELGGAGRGHYFIRASPFLL